MRIPTPSRPHCAALYARAAAIAICARRVLRKHWLSAGPMRDVFRAAFKRAGLPYYNPHSFRKTLVQRAFALKLTPEQLKAWSQNLGHEDVLTTLTSYGAVARHRQAEIMRELGGPQKPTVLTEDLLQQIADACREKLVAK